MRNENIEVISALDAKNKIVELNKNQGTVTMSFEAYYRVHHDSVMLSLLLNCKDELTRNDIIADYLKYEELGTGYTYCQCPLCDSDAIKYVYGLEGLTDA